jgi:hypothetical protein
MRLGLGDLPGADDRAVVERELGLAPRYDHRRPGAAVGEGGGHAPCDVQRRRHLGGRPRAPREDLIELVVVEAGVGADQAAVEARRCRLAGGADHDLGGDREPRNARREAAGVGAQHRRQHRVDGSRNVRAVAPSVGLRVESGARADVGRDVGDVDPQPGPAALQTGRDGVVEVACRRGIDGERVEIGEIAALGWMPGRGRRRIRRLGHHPIAKAAVAPAVHEQRLDDVAGALGRAEPTQYPSAPAIDLGERHLPGVDLRRALGERNLRPRLEQRASDREPTPSCDHDHPAPADVAGGPPRAHCC